jgi:hypothetical protein
MTLLRWVSRVFSSSEEIRTFLETLSEAQSLHAKIDDYVVFYPIFAKEIE